MSCTLRQQVGARPVPVTVNGVTISRAAIAREVQHHPADKPITAWQAAARALVIRELLLQEARRAGIKAAPLADGEGRRETDEEAIVRALVEREISIPNADPESCRRYYDRNRSRFRSPDGAQLPFEAVSDRIAGYLRTRAWRTAVAQFMARLVSRAEIQGVELASADAHRVN
jgi:peptidyl-prolyl cis-trans isomerase C